LNLQHHPDNYRDVIGFILTDADNNPEYIGGDGKETLSIEGGQVEFDGIAIPNSGEHGPFLVNPGTFYARITGGTGPNYSFIQEGYESLYGPTIEGNASEINGVSDISVDTKVLIRTDINADNGSFTKTYRFEFGKGDATVSAGPGITVEELETQNFKVSVDLADTNPGLEFTNATDDGELRVFPDESEAIHVDAFGVGVTADEEAALTIDPALGLQVKADAEKAIIIDATKGLQVVADTTEAIKIDSAKGLQWSYNGDKGLEVEDNKAIVELKAKNVGALDVDGGGIFVAFDANGPLFIGENGLDVGIADLGGITFDDSGNLKADTEGTDYDYTLANASDGWVGLNAAGKISHGDPQTVKLDTETDIP